MAIVQTNQSIAASAATGDVNHNFGFTGTSGRLLVAMVAAPVGQYPSMSTAGWTNCLQAHPDRPNAGPIPGRIGIWYKISNGTETTFSAEAVGLADYVSAVVECSGPDPVSSLDLSASSSGTGTVLDTGPLTRPSAPESGGVAYAVFTTTDVATLTATGVWTALAAMSTSTSGGQEVRGLLARRYLTVSEGQQATGSSSASVDWQAAFVSFKSPLAPNLPAPMQSVR